MIFDAGDGTSRHFDSAGRRCYLSPFNRGRLDEPFPLQYALNALQYLQALHSRSSDPVSDGWTFISEKGFPLHRKLALEISASLPVYRGERVIEDISAEEIAVVVTSYDARTRWDEHFVGAHMLEVFAGAGGAHTAFTMSKVGFPFCDRGFCSAFTP
jgi:hypothetical protein